MALAPQEPQPGKVNAPATVPLAQAGEERQRQYGALADMNEKLDMNAFPNPHSSEMSEVIKRLDTEPEPEPAAEEPELVIEPSEEDKTAFVRALLGDKSFEKTYTIFGKISVVLRDRTAFKTEVMYEQLERAEGVDISTPELHLLWRERFQVACNLLWIKRAGLTSKEYPETDQLHDRLKALLELPKPLFQAVLQVNRDFEQLVSYMTDKAQNSDFWLADGSTSRPARTSSAPSTSEKAAAGRVGA